MIRPALHPVLLLGALWLAAPAEATPVTDAAAAIDGKLEGGDVDGALGAARDLLALVWDQSAGLGFTQSLLVAENATGFGVYNPRDNNIFKKGAPILIYCEPYGFGYGTPGAGIYSVNFIVDLQVLDASGNQLADWPNTTEYTTTSRHKNREVQASITYTLDGLAPGHYTLITTLHDKNSSKSGSFQTAIEIAE